MATGKTNMVYCRTYFDEVDLSGDARSIAGFGREFDEVDATGFSSSISYYTLGQQRTIFDGYQALFNNTALLGAFTELKTKEEYFVSLHLGIRAAPAVGDPAWGARLNQASMNMDGSDALLLSIIANPGAGAPATDAPLDKNWGHVLAPLASRDATYTGASINNGASSSAGAYAILHVTSVDAGGAWTLITQHSADDTNWATLHTFTANAQTLAGELQTTSSTVNQYTRALLTDTGLGSGWSGCVTFIRR